MSIVLYYQTGSSVGRYLEASIGAYRPVPEKAVCHSLGDLESMVRQPLNGHDILMVLVITSEEELRHLESIRKLIHRFRIIIILTCRDADAVSKAYSLNPRYLAFSDSDTKTTTDIICNMADKITGVT